jgi:hypothetical protein
MSNRYDDEGRRLGEAMHGQVDSMADAPLSFDDVAGRARSMRRNRRLAIGAGILAAAVAVIVPTTMFAGDGLPTDGDPPPVASNTPSSSPSASPDPTGDPVTGPFDVSGLPTGDAPAIVWADGTTIHRPDGSTVEVSGLAGIDDIAPMGDGFVVATVDDVRGLQVVLVDADGTPGDVFPLDGGLATSPQGEVVAWAAPDGEVTAVQAEGDEVIPLPAVSVRGPYEAVAVTSEDCSSEDDDGGCSVLVNTKGNRPVLTATGSHGPAGELPGGIRTLTAYRGFYVGITEVDELEPSTCSELQDELGVTRWETCEHRVLGISPNSEHLIGANSYADGYGDTELAILRADGTVLVQLNRRDETMATPFDQVWEDDEHVLTVTFQEGRWAVVRVGLDGSMEYAVPPVGGDEFGFPFNLQHR